jgi:hypothetical protein
VYCEGDRLTYLPAVASCEEIFVKVLLSWLPSEFTTVMMATEIPAAINPYSMAVWRPIRRWRTAAEGQSCATPLSHKWP